MAPRVLALLTLVLGAPALLSAQDRFRHGRVRYVEDGTTIQRATETGAEEAVANLPYLPGDRVWTDGRGRAEFQFAGGSVLRLDSGSKLDYVAHDDGRRERLVLRVWSGGLYLHSASRDGAFEIETPGGVVTADGRGVLRIDVEDGEARLSVYEGDARLEDVRVRAGERAYARDGRVEEPKGFDRAETDNFDLWNEEQDRQMTAYSGQNRLPEDLSIYEAELGSSGVWYQEPDHGYVWRPRVGIGWRPYFNGRWTWSPYGWTWVPYERWGWATSHYGRWGHSAHNGWYWIPSSGWGAAWVSWAVGGDYVGWCPLGYGNRPVVINHVTIVNRGGHRGRGQAVPRGSVNTWTYARRGDLSSRDLAQRRMDRVDVSSARSLRVIEGPHQARLTRELSVAAPGSTPAAGGPRAVPRTARTKPTIADTVPELRADPMYTIPFPTARRKPTSEDKPEEGEADPGTSGSGMRRLPRRHSESSGSEAVPRTPEATGEQSRETPVARSFPRRRAVSTAEPAPENTGEQAGEAAERRFPRRHSDRQASEPRQPEPGGDHPTDFRTPTRRTSTMDSNEEDRPRRRRTGEESPEPTKQPESSPRERARESDPGRDVMRPVFRPLGRTRSEDGGAAVPHREPRSEPRREREEPRSEPRQERSEPRRERPRPHAVEPPARPSQPPAGSSSSEGRARRRNRDE